MHTFILGIAVCATIGLAVGPASSASLRRDRACYSSGDPALRLLCRSVLRVARRGGDRVFVSALSRPPLTVGVAF
jgi:hypothetical protein